MPCWQLQKYFPLSFGEFRGENILRKMAILLKSLTKCFPLRHVSQRHYRSHHHVYKAAAVDTLQNKEEKMLSGLS